MENEFEGSAAAEGENAIVLEKGIDIVGSQPSQTITSSHDIVIVGGGAGGQAVAASLLKRQPNLDISIIEPSAEHYYHPSEGVYQTIWEEFISYGIYQ